jgi:hypothetical protein
MGNSWRRRFSALRRAGRSGPSKHSTPGRKGPRSSNFRRVLADSAMNRPFFVPMQRMSRSAMFRAPSELFFGVLQDGHQGNKAPSAFPLLHRNHENGSASRNCGHDEKGVAGFQRSFETIIAEQQIHIHKKMNVPPNRSDLGADTSLNGWMILLKLQQSIADRRRGHDQLRTSTALRSSRRRNLNWNRSWHSR